MNITNSILATSSYWAGVKETLPDALVNTVIGIAVVFVALVFISFIISLFGSLTSKFSGKGNKKQEKAAAPVPSAPVEEEEELDDTELIAVISAAISAYEEENGTAHNGLFVRSIKKINKTSWQNA